MFNKTTFSLLSSDIRKLKAALAAPLDFGEGDNDVDGETASEVSAIQVPKKVRAHSFDDYASTFYNLFSRHFIIPCKPTYYISWLVRALWWVIFAGSR